MRQTYYRTCPICHSALDPGESCDCQDEKEPDHCNDADSKN